MKNSKIIVMSLIVIAIAVVAVPLLCTDRAADGDDDTLEVTLQQQRFPLAGGFSYSVNEGLFQTYSVPFEISKDDVLKISYSVTNPVLFLLRWVDDRGNFLGTTSSITPDLSAYTGTVEFIAMLDLSKTEVTLESDPQGAQLKYTIEGLNEEIYTGPFIAGNYDKITVVAPESYQSQVFLRWTSQGEMFAVTPSTVIGAYGDEVTYTAVYAYADDCIRVTLDQTGGANAPLYFGIGYADLTYAGEFRVLKDDDLWIDAFSPSGYKFMRWTDTGNVLKTAYEDPLNPASLTPYLPLYSYMGSVSFIAMFSNVSDLVDVTLRSNPENFDLSYKIDSLALQNSIFTTVFPMNRSEKLSLFAPSEVNYTDFIRWETEDPPTTVSSQPVLSNILLPTTGNAVTYVAVYSNEFLMVSLAQMGGANSSLSYSIDGGPPEIFSTPIKVLKTSTLEIYATEPSGHIFMRWAKGSSVVSNVSTATPDLSLYWGQITFTAMFDTETVEVTLESDPSNAPLTYSIGSLNSENYSAPFLIGRSESLSVTAPNTYSSLDFVRWTGPSAIIGTTTTVTGITIPGTGDAVTYTVEYASPSSVMTVILTASGLPAGTDPLFDVAINGVSVGNVAIFYISAGESFTAMARNVLGYSVSSWTYGMSNITGDTIAVTAAVGMETTYTAVYTGPAPPSPVNNQTIKATSDSGSTITPSGNVPVSNGGSATFTFSAKNGYVLTDLLIDGVSYSELLSNGTYTFTNVTYNRTIDVRSEPLALTLEVKIIQGKGSVQYSINNGPLTTYSGIVTLTEGDNVTVIAKADDGYAFERWYGSSSSTDAQVSFTNVTSPIYLEASFSVSPYDDGGNGKDPWFWAGITVFIVLLAGLLIWFLLFYMRRSYEVIKLTANIIGEDRARRKKEYVFTIDGSASSVIYRIGEKEGAEWSPAAKKDDGSFAVPKGEITDKVFIEAR